MGGGIYCIMVASRVRARLDGVFGYPKSFVTLFLMLPPRSRSEPSPVDVPDPTVGEGWLTMRYQSKDPRWQKSKVGSRFSMTVRGKARSSDDSRLLAERMTATPLDRASSISSARWHLLAGEMNLCDPSSEPRRFRISADQGLLRGFDVVKKIGGHGTLAILAHRQ